MRNIPTLRTGFLLAQKLKEKLIADNVPVLHVYLFGSTANDEATHDSDIDVLVVTKPFKDSIYEEKKYIWHEGAALDIRLECLCMRPEQFDNKYSSLAKEVRHTGVPV